MSEDSHVCLSKAMPLSKLLQQLTAALDACVRWLLDEMKTVATVNDDSCTMIKETSSTSSKGSTMKPETENVLGKKFDPSGQPSTGNDKCCRCFC